MKSHRTETEDGQCEQPREDQAPQDESDEIEEEAVKEAISVDASKAEVSIKGWRLVGDCPTRWGSAYKMLTRALKMEDAVGTLTARYRRTDLANYVISVEEWQKLKILHGILEPFTKLAALSEADKCPTLPFVVPYYNLLLETLATEAESRSCMQDLLLE